MFGEDWRNICTALFTDSFDTMLSFDGTEYTACTDGKRHDLSDGSPAAVKFYASGAIKRTGHYLDGRLQDSEDGSPAQVDYNEDWGGPRFRTSRSLK